MDENIQEDGEALRSEGLLSSPSFISTSTESIELTRNAKGKYYWKIKILSTDTVRLEKINFELLEKFGE